MSKDIKKALEHCINNECVDCPNNEELGSGQIVCRARLLPEVLEYVADLETKLAESEKQVEDAREAGNMAVDSWCKNRRKYEAQIAEMQNKSFILYSMLYETLEKQGCENVASQIDQMTGWTYDKEADWLKGNRNYDQLKQQLAGKGREIADLQHRLEVSERAVESAVEIANIKSNHFWTVEELKEQAEAEINKRSNNDER